LGEQEGKLKLSLKRGEGKFTPAKFKRKLVGTLVKEVFIRKFSEAIDQLAKGGRQDAL
jgi:hypothetical protein